MNKISYYFLYERQILQNSINRGREVTITHSGFNIEYSTLTIISQTFQESTPDVLDQIDSV